MEKFKAYRITEIDKRSVRAEFVQCSLEDHDAARVVVRVAYSDINYKDALAATGKGRILLRPSCIGGIDLSGTVVSVEPMRRFARGTRVLVVGHELGVKHHGGYADYARVPANWVVKLPAGAEPVGGDGVRHRPGYTAGLAIGKMERNGLRPENGQCIVNGATGGVGSIAIAALGPTRVSRRRA
jgi:alcohol dehydrogenase